jgi:hypothetical protein
MTREQSPTLKGTHWHAAARVPLAVVVLMINLGGSVRSTAATPPDPAGGSATGHPSVGPARRETVREALDALRASAPGRVDADRAADWSRVHAVRGMLAAPGPEAPRAIADRFLSRHAALFGSHPDLSDLVLAQVRESPAGRHFRFGQTHRGLPVFDAGIDVHVRRDGAVFLVHNRYAPGLELDPHPAVAAADAARLARRGSAGEAATIELGIDPGEEPGRARLAWRVVVLAADPAGARESLIDARTGALIRERDLAVDGHVTGRGRLFDPNPVAFLGDPTLRDQDDADGPEFSPAYLDVALPGLTRAFLDLLGPVTLSGPHVRVTDFVESPFLPNVTSPDGSFLFHRDADGFESVMTYFHIDRTQRYIQSLGFAAVNNRPIRVDPHGLRGEQNAHYVGYPFGMGWIAFGTGGVDLAEDADVIWHEYGHAMQDNQNPGGYLALGEAGAQGEGFGDYWAYVNTVLTGPALADPECVGEWAFEGECLRRTDSGKHYPEDLEREVHADGEIWSSVLRDVARDIGPDTANAIILESHFLVPRFPRFCAGAAALRDADDALYAGANRTAVAGAAARHGIGADLTAGAVTVTPIDPAGVRLGFEIANRGPCSSGPVFYSVHLIGGASGDHGEVASAAIDGLTPGAAIVVDLTLPALPDEPFFYRILVDPAGVEFETDETNNVTESPILP